MSNLIRREDVIEVLYEAIRTELKGTFTDSMSLAIAMGNNIPSAEPEIIRCKDCKHKPSGNDILFPDEVCPCQCEDPWYSWMPKDDWYCGFAEKRTDE